MQDGKRKTVTRQLLGACLAAFIALGTGAAQAQTAADMDARLDTLFGEHASYRGFFDKLKQAVAAGDKAAVAAMADYPFRTRLDGKAATLRDAEHFIADYDRLITPKVRDAVSRQTYPELFANWQGISIGSGEIWFGGVGKRNEVKITAINH
ncbi:MAG: hypothetical protein ABS43_31210 [Bordetella sp. SCN 67-23]|nr:hypothetical protein [Burkholderiales bacterium]ODS65990.1 MAG: hypothetical protein ABS43_31210 [Bordetella sp. SCN 67-23]ODU73700.1 MAG: hypothetical protein ABT00_16560 [Bordetella sp. SCN 68-11]OJW87917.1 MAG: hypothetical protein BGO71_11225 [Burkholderiales bacterium 67-32]